MTINTSQPASVRKQACLQTVVPETGHILSNPKFFLAAIPGKGLFLSDSQFFLAAIPESGFFRDDGDGGKTTYQLVGNKTTRSAPSEIGGCFP